VVTALVIISNPVYGDTWAVCRDLTSKGATVEMSYAPPLEEIVTIRFGRVTYEEGLTDFMAVRARVVSHQRDYRRSQDPPRLIELRFIEVVGSNQLWVDYQIN